MSSDKVNRAAGTKLKRTSEYAESGQLSKNPISYKKLEKLAKAAYTKTYLPQARKLETEGYILKRDSISADNLDDYGVYSEKEFVSAYVRTTIALRQQGRQPRNVTRLVTRIQKSSLTIPQAQATRGALKTFQEENRKRAETEQKLTQKMETVGLTSEEMKLLEKVRLNPEERKLYDLSKMKFKDLQKMFAQKGEVLLHEFEEAFGWEYELDERGNKKVISKGKHKGEFKKKYNFWMWFNSP